jgi:hypothetical protein
VTTPLDLAPRPSNELHPLREEGELAVFLELFGPAEIDAAPARPSFRSSLSAMLGWAQDSSRRAARWGAVAGVQR